MKRYLVLVIVVFAVFVVAANARASILLFADDFTGTIIDNAKWSTVGSYGTVSQNDEAIFNVLGNNASNAGIRLQSVTIAVPEHTTSGAFSGEWRIGPSADTFAPQIIIYNADATSKYIGVSYITYDSDPHGNSLSFFDQVTPISSSDAYYSRPHHSDMVPFEFYLSDSGWSYSENGTVLKSYASDFTDNLDNFLMRIGGWDYSAGSGELVYFDNINIAVETRVIPEPASLSLLGLGLLGLAGFGRKKK